MSNDHDRNVATTYLALRLGLVLLLGLLGVSVGGHALFVATCYPLSISAYYYTPAGPVFVAGLAAIGACLIVYRGNTDTENVLLDFCGFLALVVAFVPTPTDRRCGGVPSADIGSIVTNNVISLLVVGFIATGVGVWLLRSRLSIRRLGGTNVYAKRSLIVSGLALLAGVVYFFSNQDRFRETGHLISAFALFAGIVAVVGVNAWGFAREQARLEREARSRKETAFKAARNRYGIVAWLMLGSVGLLVLIGPVLGRFDHYFFAAEAALILLFAAFWLLQTFELKGDVARGQSNPEATSG